MADKIAISGVAPYDGEYEFDTSRFTNRELHIIKRIAGVRSGELEDALEAGDTDLFVALAIIAMHRHGKVVDEDKFWDADLGAVTFLGGEQEADQFPPAEPETRNENEPAGSSDANAGSSSSDSVSGSESSASDPSPTGTPVSPGLAAVSGPAT